VRIADAKGAMVERAVALAPRLSDAEREAHARFVTSLGDKAIWLDYVKHSGQAPFLSKNAADASRNFTEIMFALSVLDLPFEPEESPRISEVPSTGLEAQRFCEASLTEASR
jgi:hypothetical protein